MSLRRHSRLSSSTLNSKPVRRLATSLSSRASTVAKSINASRKAAKQQRANKRLERREIDKFLGMAKNHLPDDISSLSEDEKWSLVYEYLIATLLRASCTSKRDIEAIVVKVLAELNSDDVYKDVNNVSQLNERVVKFLLGGYGTPMVSTLGPAKFDQTKELKRLLISDFADDPEFTAYEILSTNKKAYVNAALGVRQKASEKINTAIYKIFDNESGENDGDSIYENEARRTITECLKEYTFQKQLPADWVIEREYGLNLIQNCKVDSLVSDWAAGYGVDMPTDGIEDGLLSFVSNRAIHKGKQPINYFAEILIGKIKRIRGANDDVHEDSDGNVPAFPFSQPLMPHDDDVSDVEKDVTESTSNNIDSARELTPEEVMEPAEEDPKSVLKKSGFKLSNSFEDSSDDEIEIIDTPPRKKVSRPLFRKKTFMPKEKPRLPYMDRGRKRKSIEVGREKTEVKKPKVSVDDFMDGLPDLEPMTQK